MSSTAASEAELDISSPSSPRELGGDTLVLGFILSLIAFLLIFAAVMTANLEGDDWRLLVPGVARLLSSALAAIGLLIALAAYRRGRSGWWWYALGALVPVVQLAVIGLWFARARREPVPFGRWTL